MSLRGIADQFLYAKTQAADDGVAMIAHALADLAIELQDELDDIKAKLTAIEAKIK